MPRKGPTPRCEWRLGAMTEGTPLPLIFSFNRLRIN